MRVGVAAPLSGPFALLGQQLSDGAHLATTMAPPGTTATPIVVDDKCSAEGGAAAAETFIKAGVRIVTGFFCTEALEAALPLLAEKNIPVLTPSIRERGLTERRAKEPLPVFRLALPSDREAAAAGEILANHWRDKPFAIIDDGTIRGRELAHGVRTAIEAKGLKPVYTDTYRPGLDNQSALVALLRRAGATQVFIGGERGDAAAIASAAAKLNYPLEIASDEALRAASGGVDLAPGTLMIAAPEAETLPSAAPAVAAIRGAGRPVEGYAVPGYASLQIAMEAVMAAEAGKQPALAILRSRTFTTVLGEIRFDESGNRSDNPYRLFRYDGSRFIPEAQ
ncbi:ABC transporter substrate-binding protein [Phyllobacterium salinisoli]|nr:ABC transporter substrate-binding protein [Phyllobacterium salinisoli]